MLETLVGVALLFAVLALIVATSSRSVPQHTHVTQDWMDCPDCINGPWEARASSTGRMNQRRAPSTTTTRP